MLEREGFQSRMTRFWLTVAFSHLLCASESVGKYSPTTLATLAGADVIAVGTIVRLSAGSYTLRVTRWVAGERPRKELRIRRFVDWQKKKGPEAVPTSATMPAAMSEVCPARRQPQT